MPLQDETSAQTSPKLSITWRVHGDGWASCIVADGTTEAEAEASYIIDGPEQLLHAVASITRYAGTASAEFEAEPTVFQWFFQRHGNAVDIRLVKARDRRSPVASGTVIWSGKSTVVVLSRAVLRAFDAVLDGLGDAGYRTRWRRAFPHHELEALRAAYRSLKQQRHAPGRERTKTEGQDD